MDYQYSEITPEVIELAKLCTQKGGIDPSLYAKYEVRCKKRTSRHQW